MDEVQWRQWTKYKTAMLEVYLMRTKTEARWTASSDEFTPRYLADCVFSLVYTSTPNRLQALCKFTTWHTAEKLVYLQHGGDSYVVNKITPLSPHVWLTSLLPTEQR